ncbi:TetR/AcrR family transcriptional regulator [Nakamurella sp.]|uniref:TetR/AcrR family transcriptional regulator n=1 Tax=Nakamurella sp. TaxID=1869182 RepID=UPI003B3A8E94
MTPEATARSRRPGRPAGDGAPTRDLVLAAARRALTDHGYTGASVRRIATAAGVDPGMIRHWFGDKAGLFRAAMEPAVDPDRMLAGVLDGDPGTLGRRLLRRLLEEWDGAGAHSPMIILVRSAVSHDESTALLRTFVGEQILGRLSGVLDGPDAALRSSLVGSQLIGLAMARCIVRVEPLASAPADQVVAAVAPTLQRYLTGPIDGEIAGR